MEVMDHSSGKVLGVRVDGTLTGDDYTALVPTIEKLITEHGKIRILVRFDRMTGVEPGAIWEDLKMSRHIRDFDRFAAVTDTDWIRRFVGLESAVFPMPIRHFALAEEDAAWRWMRDEPTS